MSRHPEGIRTFLAAAVLVMVLPLGIMFSGCGEKIAIPQPTGVFSLNQYVVLDSFTTTGPAIGNLQGLARAKFD